MTADPAAASASVKAHDKGCVTCMKHRYAHTGRCAEGMRLVREHWDAEAQARVPVAPDQEGLF